MYNQNHSAMRTLMKMACHVIVAFLWVAYNLNSSFARIDDYGWYDDFSDYWNTSSQPEEEYYDDYSWYDDDRGRSSTFNDPLFSACLNAGFTLQKQLENNQIKENLLKWIRCHIKWNISVNNEKIYHAPGCLSYWNTLIDKKGEMMFCTEDEAINAWFRRAKDCCFLESKKPLHSYMQRCYSNWKGTEFDSTSKTCVCPILRGTDRMPWNSKTTCWIPVQIIEKRINNSVCRDYTINELSLWGWKIWDWWMCVDCPKNTRFDETSQSCETISYSPEKSGGDWFGGLIIIIIVWWIILWSKSEGNSEGKNGTKSMENSANSRLTGGSPTIFNNSSVSSESQTSSDYTMKNDFLDLHLGCRIRHREFWEGVVVSLKGDIAEIVFSGTNLGTKKMNVRIAPIEKI